MPALRDALSLVLLVAAVIGVGVVCLQAWMLRLHRRAGAPPLPPPQAAGARAPISILKPLCGLDDQLADNLASFAALPYPDYEVVLGVASASDPAYSIAAQTLRRWPERFRLVIQRGAPGLNPKVNQLVGLAAAARADLLVISDSNTRVPAGYLDEIAAQLADPGVGLVTHPLAGESPSATPSCGARLDNLHLTATITPGFVAASTLCGKTYVVGKSMAMRRADLEALGGFQAVKDVLAEDFVLGRLIPAQLGKRVVLGRAVVSCISERRSPVTFAARYARWSVMQRQCSGLLAYLGLLLLNPVLLALLALALAPSQAALVALALIFGVRALADSVVGRWARGRALSPLTLALIPVKELLTGAAWAHGLCTNTIVWRSNRLRVGHGSVLTPAPAPRHRALPVLPLGTAGPRAR